VEKVGWRGDKMFGIDESREAKNGAKIKAEQKPLYSIRTQRLMYIIFKNSVRTSKRTPHFTITKINWLTLFKPLKPKLV
jgi:hypothetical protein